MLALTIIIVRGLVIVLVRNNKKFFFVYIWAQFFQVSYGFLYTCCIIGEVAMSLSKISSYLLVFSMLSELFFTLMLLSLVIFHTYLVTNNTTTWEALSWNTISYMRVWPRKYGSPFDQGLSKNIRLYFCTKPGEKIQIWKMPKKLPSIEHGEKIIKSRYWSNLLEKVCIRCQS